MGKLYLSGDSEDEEENLRARVWERETVWVKEKWEYIIETTRAVFDKRSEKPFKLSTQREREIEKPRTVYVQNDRDRGRERERERLLKRWKKSSIQAFIQIER